MSLATSSELLTILQKNCNDADPYNVLDFKSQKSNASPHRSAMKARSSPFDSDIQPVRGRTIRPIDVTGTT